MKIRIISALLAILMLAMVFSSCTQQTDNPNDQTTTTDISNEETTTSSNVTTERNIYENVPTGSYDGFEVNTLVTYHSWANNNLVPTVEESMADTIDSAMFERNYRVEDKLEVVINQTEAGSEEVVRLIKMQQDTNITDKEGRFNIAYVYASLNASLITGGYSENLADVDQIHLDEPWWDRTFTDKINMGDSVYFAVGHAHLAYFSTFYVMMFNKSIAENIQELDNIYSLYSSGDWTWAECFRIMQKASEDTDGDGMAAQNDIFGLAIPSNGFKALITSCDAYLTETNSEGYEEFNGVNDRFIAAYEYVCNFVSDPNYTFSSITPGFATYTHSVGHKQIGAFLEGRALFLYDGCGQLAANVRGGSVNYGIVGTPKLDDKQEYITEIYNGISTFVIPSGCSDLDRIATIGENLAAESYETLYPAFVENTLYTKSADTEQDSANLQRIFEGGGVTDLAYIYDWAGLISIIENAQVKRNSNIVSSLRGIYSTIRYDLNATIEAIKKADGLS